MKKLSYVILAGLSLLLMGSECIFGAKTSDQDPFVFDVSSPAKTLESLAYTYTSSRIPDDYKRLLSGSDYTFYFDPDDIGKTIAGGYVIPTSWTYQEDVNSTSKMFDEAYDIQLSFLNLGDVPEPDDDDVEIVANNVSIELYLFPDSPDFAYLATGQCDFTFKKVNDAWLIKSWSDRTNAK